MSGASAGVMCYMAICEIIDTKEIGHPVPGEWTLTNPDHIVTRMLLRFRTCQSHSHVDNTMSLFLIHSLHMVHSFHLLSLVLIQYLLN